MKGEEIWILIAATGFLSPTKTVEENSEFSSLEVARLATNVYGTEFLLLENSHYTDQTGSYKFEDFFWTGSGDGPTTDEDTAWIFSEGPAVVYKTSTVVSTVFVEATSTLSNNESTNCSFNCRPPTASITPTPTLSTANQQFWLLTVLRNDDGRNPILTEIQNSLARLYKMAFQRQQARHLKLRSKRSDQNDVEVFVHEINENRENIEILYHVEVQGKAVDASTAANDMKLVKDDEVRRELGFLFDIKAEPYVKPSEPQSLLNKAKSTWFVIGGTIIGVLVVLLVLAFVILGAAKKRRPQDQQVVGAENRRHVFERGAGYENKGLVQDEAFTSPSPTYLHFGDRHQVVLRPQSSLSSSTNSSLEISLSRKPLKRPRAAQNKTVPLRLPVDVFDSSESDVSRKKEEKFLGNFETAVVSPKSFLSMPSVKSFPRTAMPEPLARVLEPVSVTHLDHEDAEIYSRRLVRHGSVGTVEDPGVIGPIVWNVHCERLRHGTSVDELKSTNNVSKMRKRFHDLLDDTFSLFGNSRRASPDLSRPIAIEVKSHSANENRLIVDRGAQRPKTAGAKKPEAGPSCAWSSTAPSPLTRPLSAAPRISTAGENSRISSRIDSVDPAIDVIASIKGEIEKMAI
ncbi:unnamed protein product [Ceutorhynchus assimilis]|uniref:Uncharacterized protein n=1 Tax=Ceutorhynchus assimilis TaxID=467358 RepID=A0A9N9MRV7_9CUCU|nr:unnamed protein product [Ceutorhynchus assimilis]